MIEDDIPSLRAKILAANFLMVQQTGNSAEKPISINDQSFIEGTIFCDREVNRIFTLHSVSLMQAFATVANQATNSL